MLRHNPRPITLQGWQGSLLAEDWFQPRRRQPNHIPKPIPASRAPVSFLRSVIGTKRVGWLLTSMTPTGTARTPPPPPPPSPRALVSPTPPVPAPSPYIIFATGMIVFPCVEIGSP